MDKPYLILSKITYEFVQDCNTLGTTENKDELERIIIEREACDGSLHDNPGFFVLRTPTGWSIDNVSEITKLFKMITEAHETE